MADYCEVYGVIHFTSPAGWLPVRRDQLRAQCSVTSMGKLYLFLTRWSVIQDQRLKQKKPWKLYNKSSLAEKADYSKEQKNVIWKLYRQILRTEANVNTDNRRPTDECDRCIAYAAKRFMYTEHGDE